MNSQIENVRDDGMVRGTWRQDGGLKSQIENPEVWGMGRGEWRRRGD